MKFKGITYFVFILFLSTGFTKQNSVITWEKIDVGLYLGEYLSPVKSEFGDNKITILKIDPKHYAFEMVEAKQTGDQRKTAEDWCKEKKLLAAVNAGMYEPDGRNCGYMKNGKFMNNPVLNKKYNNILAFNPKDSTVPQMQIIDLTCQNWEKLKTQYNNYSQNLRMMDCNGKNSWGKTARKWSVVVWGMDTAGNALWIFCRSPFTMPQFVDILQKSPLGLKKLMYLEGGPEATFYLNHKSFERDLIGSYETGFRENDTNVGAWEIPNIIGIRKK